MIKKKDLSIEETFALAIQNQQNNDFIVAEKLYNEIIKRDPNYVNAHINLGILLIQNKKYHNAIISFEKAIELNPNFADTYYNVAVVNNLLGQNLDAIQNYEKAIQLNPKFLNAMNNLGVVFLENNEYQKAVDYFQKVILINPNISNAHNNLGSAYTKLDKHEKAIDCYEKAIAINPNLTDAHYNLGTLLKESGVHLKAINCFEKIIKIDPNYINAYNNLGNLFKELGDNKKAINCYNKIIEIDPNNSTAYLNLASAFASSEEYVKAFNYNKKAVELDPNNINSINNLTSLLQFFIFEDEIKNNTSNFKRLLLFLFRKNNINHSQINSNIVALLNEICDGQLQEIVNSDLVLLDDISIHKLLKEELFHLTLQKSLVSNIIYEKLITKLRYEIVFKLGKNNTILKEHFNFIISLAEQSWLNEYVHIVTENEINQIKQLKDKIEKNIEINELEISILGCYLPLNSSKIIENKLKNYTSSNILFNDLIKVQIKEPLREIELKKTIKSLDLINDEVSKKVQLQYEENPYPRWRYIYNYTPINFVSLINNQIKPNQIDCQKRFKHPSVLIAGCGTGSHAIAATRYKNADILGVDLSLTSLSYAKRKTEELGFKNIEFLHADILQLKKLNRKFDIIESLGTLHHMKDPIEGLKVLIKLLEPYGFIKLGLYSNFARKEVVELKELIKDKKIKNTNKDIKIFRQLIINQKRNSLSQNITSSNDFFSTSSVRDLLFHVQEHRFTITEISKILKDLNLEFLGFEVKNPSLKSKFLKQFPNDKKAILLDNWNTFEKNNSTTFSSMYVFWLKKI